MKKLILSLLIFLISFNLFAIRVSIENLTYYFNNKTFEKKNNSSYFFYEPSADDFNSSWHFDLKENDFDFFSKRDSWHICKEDMLQDYVDQESSKGDVIIHYKDDLFYVGVNKERKPTVLVEAYLNNFFDGKQYICEKYLFGDDEMTFAFCPNKEDEKIFQRAILFQSEEDKIIPRLFFYGGRINNAYPNEMLVNMKSSTKDFYGLSIHHVDGYNTFSINCYWKQGKDVADSILLEWKNNRFRKYKIDEEIL